MIERLAADGPPAVPAHFHTCPLCEATCGLEIEVGAGQVLRVRGDRDDVFSGGYLCPKGASLGHLQDDPDRLRSPMVRDGDRWAAVEWDEAFHRVAEGLRPVVDRGDPDAIAVYFGNPIGHGTALTHYSAAMVRALGTGNVFSAGSVDSASKLVAAGLMYGSPASVAVPDIDRTAHLVVLGANPVTSNGSLWTVPDVRSRLRSLRARGGRLVVVDPRRTATAEIADDHIRVRPGSDALLLLGIAHTLDAEGLVALRHLEGHVDGVDEILGIVRGFPPERVAAGCGVDASVMRGIARGLAHAPSAAVYGRMGTSTQEFGTLASWLIDVINVLTGNLDRPGGAMFPKPVAGSPNTTGPPGRGRGLRMQGPGSRVRGLPRLLGELPVVVLAEEIETAGTGQVRALVTFAGNPVLSTPNGRRLDAALTSLDFMVSIDPYRNETTRHAHVILPPVGPLERDHFDTLLYRYAARNVANYSEPVLAPPQGALHDWQIMVRVALAAGGDPTGTGLESFDEAVATRIAERSVRDRASSVGGRPASELLDGVAHRAGPARLLDLLVRTGPYGDGFGANPGGLSLDVLMANPHGIDLGALQPRIPEILRTPSGRIELAPKPLVADVERLHDLLHRAHEPLVLIGRRDQRSNNSWMHNVPALMRGRPRWYLELHPDDAVRAGVSDGDDVVVRSRVGAIEAPVRVTTDVAPGVACLPHGWGHTGPGIQLSVASQKPGASVNDLTDGAVVDVISGNAILNGVPVVVEPLRGRQPSGSSGPG